MKTFRFYFVKRLISLVLCVMILLSTCPPTCYVTGVQASTVASRKVIDHGILNTTIMWTVYDDGMLDIDGTGALISAPWSAYADQITDLVVHDGITSFAEGIFSQCQNLVSVSLPFIGENREATGENGRFTYLFGLDYTLNGHAFTCDRHDNPYQGPFGTTYNYYHYFKYNYPVYQGGTVVSDCETLISEGYASCEDSHGGYDGIRRRRGASSGYVFYQVGSGYAWYSYYYFSRTMVIGGGRENIYDLHTCYYRVPESLTSVTVTDAKQLCADAFANIGNLEEVRIGGDLTTISEYAFRNCKKLTTISLPSTLTTVGTGAFDDTPWYQGLTDEFAVCGDGVWIKYNGTSANISVPVGIRHIADGLLRYSSAVRTIVLPDGLRSIGSYAFYSEAVTIPYSVRHIGERAFDSIYTECSVYRPSVAYQMCVDNDYQYKTLEQSFTTGNDTFYYVVKADGYAAIIGCETTSTELTVPTDLNGTVVNEIGDGGFQGCTTINSITIPGTVKTIGGYAFYGCTGLVNVTIPQTVQSVGESAFEGCTALKNATISEGVLSIGDHAFRNCSSLIEAIVPDSTVTLGDYVFYNCRSLETATIGVNAQQVGDYAFYGCESLTTVVIGTGVKSIGNHAFDGDTLLKNAMLGSSTQTIGEYAFRDCSLERVTFPASVVSIGKYAFYGMDTLAKVTFRAGLQTIHDYAFADCPQLTTLNLPSSLKTIGKGAFRNDFALASVTFPSELTTLKNHAFAGCASLTGVTIPAGVTVLEECTFSGCTSLTEASFSNGLTAIGYETFKNCALLNLTLPETLGVLGKGAFENCISLENVYLPDVTEYIGERAFGNCKALSAISMPDCVDYVGAFAYSNNNNLTVTVRAVSGAIKDDLLASQGVAHIVLDEEITAIGDRAFANCNELTTVTYGNEHADTGEFRLSPNVTAIGEEAFAQTPHLKCLHIPDTVQAIGASAVYTEGSNGATVSVYYEDGVIATGLLQGQHMAHVIVGDYIRLIGNQAFASCPNMVDVSLPDTIEVCGIDVFTDSSQPVKAIFRAVDGTVDACTYDGKTDGLQELVFEEGIRTIGDYAFSHMQTVQSITSGTLETVGAYTFSDSPMLKSVQMEAATDIGQYAFYNDVAILSFEVKQGLRHIGAHALQECKGISALTLPETVESIGAYVFYNCNALKAVNIPTGITRIEEYTFFGCASLQKMILPENVTFIGDYAFYGCVMLAKADLGNAVETIGEAAFYNCNQLMTISLPETLRTIGTYAFRGCSSLMEIEVPDNTTGIGDCAFYGCTALQNVTFGDGVTIIGDRVFYACVNLTKVVLYGNVDAIHEMAFYGAEGAVMYAFDNACVETYCDTCGLEYVNLSEGATLEITTLPYKTVYRVGELLDTSGMVITLTSSEGTRMITSGYTVQGFDTNVAGEQFVQVMYNGVSGTFAVEVKAKRTVGDINDDGKVESTDVMMLFYHVSGENLLSEEDILYFDTNADGTLNIRDALRLFQFINDQIAAL